LSQHTVATRYGSVRGVARDDVVCFYNVPYARPPLGELRFCEALPPEPWSRVRDATVAGPIAPQPPAGLGSYVPGDPTEQSEDCLSLNVFTASLEGQRRPVVVFVHGGAFVTGTGAGVMYDGASLARQGVVVVTLNYRLGALGFLAHRALARPGHPGFGNWGLSDVLLALGFIADHAAAFGGDARRVTVVGESAGAMIVADLLGAPRASGLFSRAVLESGAVLVEDPATAEAHAEELASLLGVGTLSREALCAMPVSELLDATAVLSERLGGGLSMPFRPVVEPGMLPEHPERAIQRGKAGGVATLIGTNRDEFKLFTFSSKELAALEEADLEALVARCGTAAVRGLELDARQVLAGYRSAAAGGSSPGRRELFDALATDLFFRAPALRLAEAQSAHAPVYCYEFAWPSPFMDGVLGACHGIELPFVFGTHANPVIALFAGAGDAAERLGAAVQGAWVRFAQSGDPSGGAIGSWPRYLPGRATMVLGASCELIEAPGEPLRQLWEEHLPRYGGEATEISEALRGT